LGLEHKQFNYTSIYQFDVSLKWISKWRLNSNVLPTSADKLRLEF